ncbi:hypothetical protein L0F63_002587 [Massospora cicadina]|nr:hypothetical protein L0F63_002587 [Massospora cicadina]
MKPRNYFSQPRDPQVSRIEPSRKGKAGSRSTKYRNSVFFSTSDMGSDRDDLSSSSPRRRFGRRNERAPAEEYVVVRGATGGKSVIRAFSSTAKHLTDSPLMTPHVQRPRPKRLGLFKHCQSCRLVVSRASMGSGQLRCKGCSGLWHRACAPQSWTPEKAKHFMCFNCLAFAPTKNLPFMEACTLIDLWTTNHHDSDVDIMGDDELEVRDDEPVVSQPIFGSPTIPRSGASEEDGEICLTCDGDYTATQPNATASVMEPMPVDSDELHWMSPISNNPDSSEMMIDVVNGDSDSPQLEDLELDILTIESLPPAATFESRDVEYFSAVDHAMETSSPSDILPSSPIPIELEDEDFDSSSCESETHSESEVECRSEVSPEPLDSEESYHLRQREEQLLIQQVMSATYNWDSQDEDEYEESPSPKLPLSSDTSYACQGLCQPTHQSQCSSVAKDPIYQAVDGVKLLTLEDLVDVDQLECNPPPTNPFDTRSAAALARWDRFPVTGFQHQNSLPPAQAPAKLQYSLSICSAPSLFSGVSELASECATPTQSLLSPPVLSLTSPYLTYDLKDLFSLIPAGKKTKAAPTLPGRVGRRQQKERQANSKRRAAALDCFLGINKGERTTLSSQLEISQAQLARYARLPRS